VLAHSYEPTHDDAARLLEQAATLDALATRKREEASELAREAAELRIEVERITREPLTILANRAERGRRFEPDDTRFLDRIVDALATGPMAMAGLSDHVGASPARVRKAVARLVAVGSVKRTGNSRATRYELTECNDDAAPAPTPVRFRVISTTHPTAHELRDRDVAWTTAAPAVEGALPERDGD